MKAGPTGRDGHNVVRLVGRTQHAQENEIVEARV